MIQRITDAYVRHYTDNGQTTAYVEWVDREGKSGRTEGQPDGAHMQALLKMAAWEGVAVREETW